MVLVVVDYMLCTQILLVVLFTLSLNFVLYKVCRITPKILHNCSVKHTAKYDDDRGKHGTSGVEVYGSFLKV